MKLRLLAVVALVLLAGCTSSGLEPSEAYEGSAAVNGATLHDTGDGLVLNVTLADTIEHNDEYCQINPATKMTTCYDDWENAKLSGVTVMQNESTYQSFDVSGGDTISMEIPWEDATYVYQFESEDGHQTEFQVTIEASSEGAEIVSAGYDDEI